MVKKIEINYYKITNPSDGSKTYIEVIGNLSLEGVSRIASQNPQRVTREDYEEFLLRELEADNQPPQESYGPSPLEKRLK